MRARQRGSLRAGGAGLSAGLGEAPQRVAEGVAVRFAQEMEHLRAAGARGGPGPRLPWSALTCPPFRPLWLSSRCVEQNFLQNLIVFCRVAMFHMLLYWTPATFTPFICIFFVSC